MNKLQKLIVGIALLTGITAFGQTNSPTDTNSSTTISLDTFKPLITASNWIVVPYATYAPDAPTKIGGGVLALYNVNQFVGGGVGVDWLGHFSLVSGNLSLKYPINVNLFGKSYTLSPFALGGVATATGGAGSNNGGISTIEGAGVAADKLFTLWGGQVGLGVAMINWTGAGDYSGKHYQGFLSWHKTF